MEWMSYLSDGTMAFVALFLAREAHLLAKTTEKTLSKVQELLEALSKRVDKLEEEQRESPTYYIYEQDEN